MRTALIVDDKAAHALEPAYEIVEAGTAEARLAFSSSPPDLVLRDVVMPGEDGLSVLRGCAQLAVKCLRAHGLGARYRKDAVEALQSGAADYLMKGFDIAELRARVANILRVADLGAENERLRHKIIADGQELI